MYKAVKSFTDLQDNNYKYQPGDTFPRKGLKVSAERIEELSTDKNRRHIPVIAEVVKEKVEEEKTEQKSAPKKSTTTKKPTTGGRKKADAK